MLHNGTLKNGYFLLFKLFIRVVRLSLFYVAGTLFSGPFVHFIVAKMLYMRRNCYWHAKYFGFAGAILKDKR
jgi:hypothetical protein